MRTVGPKVRAALDLRDMFPEKFRQILQSGGSLHLRVQAELWEDRPVWDRLVRPAIVTVFRIVRDPTTAQIAISDAFGQVLVRRRVSRCRAVAGRRGARRRRLGREPLLSPDDRDRGTIAERDIEETSEAVFGRDEGTVSLGKVGQVPVSHRAAGVGLPAEHLVRSPHARFQGRELRPGFRSNP